MTLCVSWKCMLETGDWHTLQHALKKIITFYARWKIYGDITGNPKLEKILNFDWFE